MSRSRLARLAVLQRTAQPTRARLVAAWGGRYAVAMSDRLFFPLAFVAIAVLIALAVVWP